MPARGVQVPSLRCCPTPPAPNTVYVDTGSTKRRNGLTLPCGCGQDLPYVCLQRIPVFSWFTWTRAGPRMCAHTLNWEGPRDTRQSWSLGVQVLLMLGVRSSFSPHVAQGDGDPAKLLP